ncbi:Rhodanese-like domain-containing protein [Lipomyces japonicus]|uniref:Rhodanese-like domain-containing protein n=1 Tax=Lipomyces japonicus TaxID=56871 RepID=UPI0034CF647E
MALIARTLLRPARFSRQLSTAATGRQTTTTGMTTTMMMVMRSSANVGMRMAQLPVLTTRRTIVAQKIESVRFFQSGQVEVPPANEYQYEDIKKLTQNPNPDKILIDVREPAELAAEGYIPSAINIPYNSSPTALSLPEDEFELKFGFSKPNKDKELIFYCLGGVRCNYSQELAGQFGYARRANYLGSWEDWVAREKAAAAEKVNK